MKATLIFFLLILLSISTTLSAQETVTIGTQVWMTNNLNVDKFRNGDPIPQAKTNEEWKAAGENKQPAWCYYDNDPANGAKYGKLYNWYAVNDARGLAPAGYHVPSDAEWTILENQLGSDAGTKMKSTSGWKGWETGGSKTCPNCSDWNAEYRRKVPCHVCKDSRSVPSAVVKHSGNGTNSSGFNGQAGGYRDGDGYFYFIGKYGYWWSSSEKDATWAWYRILHYVESLVGRNRDVKGNGLSVRCLRDGLAGEANQVGKGNGNLKSSKLDEAPKQSLRDGLTGGGEGGGNGTGNGIGSGSGSGMSWKLDGRSMKSTPKVNGTAPDDGTVTVDIWVDANGNVTKVIANAAKSNTSNGTLFRMAEDAARKAKFSSSPTGNEQKGSIKITFKLP